MCIVDTRYTGCSDIKKMSEFKSKVTDRIISVGSVMIVLKVSDSRKLLELHRRDNENICFGFAYVDFSVFIYLHVNYTQTNNVCIGIQVMNSTLLTVKYVIIYKKQF